MSNILALTILLVVYAFGQWVAQKTRATLSCTLVMSLVLLIAFWLGLPGDILDVSTISGIGMVTVGISITALGTNIDFAELRRQWKTVIIGFLCVAIATMGIIFIGQLLIGRDTAIAGAPIFAGANAATLIMITALTEKGMESLGTFCVMVLVTQSFVGIPIASFFLKREARRFLKEPGNLDLYLHTASDSPTGSAVPRKRKLLEIPGSNTPEWNLAKLGIVSTISFYAAGLTNGPIHYFVFVLLLGIVFAQLGFLERDSLFKTGSATFILFATTAVMFGTLAQTTPQMILDMILPLLLCLGIGVICVILMAFVLSRILRIGFGLAVAIGISCTFGYPPTLFISNEVANAIGQTEEEKTALRNYILPKMLTAGFVTVTISSVFIAGVVAGLL